MDWLIDLKEFLSVSKHIFQISKRNSHIQTYIHKLRRTFLKDVPGRLTFFLIDHLNSGAVQINLSKTDYIVLHIKKQSDKTFHGWNQCTNRWISVLDTTIQFGISMHNICCSTDFNQSIQDLRTRLAGSFSRSGVFNFLFSLPVTKMNLNVKIPKVVLSRFKDKFNSVKVKNGQVFYDERFVSVDLTLL